MSGLIYVADDDLHIRQLIVSFLQKAGLEAVGFENGQALLTAAQSRMPDAAVVDVMMPGMDGLEVCTLLRQMSNLPIMLVSAKDTELDRITGITLGADDYVVKPFSPMELVVRVKALLRRMEMNRAEPPQKTSLVFGDLTVDPRRREVLQGGQLMAVTPTEFDFLSYMIINRDKAVSKAELLRELWHFEYQVDTRAADDLVKRLRRKLAAQESQVRIETVWGYGFRLRTEDEL